MDDGHPVKGAEELGRRDGEYFKLIAYICINYFLIFEMTLVQNIRLHERVTLMSTEKSEFKI